MSLNLDYLRDNVYLNRNQLRRLTRYFKAKRATLFKWLYFYLKKGDKTDRWYERRIRETVESVFIRHNRLRRYLEVGTSERALSYAREILTEHGARTTLTDLFTLADAFLETARRKKREGILEEEDVLELLEEIIFLKEREIEVLSELRDRLLELHPERPEWATRISHAISYIQIRLDRKYELLPPPPPPPEKVDVVQFLASLSIKCITGDIEERHIEARMIAELTVEDFENTDKGAALLEEYIRLLGYDDILDECEETDPQFGTSIIKEFTLDRDKVKTHRFTARFELFDYDRDPPSLRFKHTFDNISLNWQKTDELLTKLTTVITGGYVSDYKKGKGVKGTSLKRHIWEDKGVKRPDGVPEDGYLKDGAGISSTMSEIVPIIVEYEQLGQDLDISSTEFQKLRSLFNMELISNDIAIFRSSSGNGIHMEAKDRSTNWNNRLFLGDCRGRLFFSSVRSLGYSCKDDVLFISKKKGKNGKMRNRTPIDRENLLCLPFTSNPPTIRRKPRRN